jgi:hypothetical protein
MKTVRQFCVLTVVGLNLAGAVAVGQAQVTNYVYSFDTAGSDASWIRWWGVQFEKPAWDPSMDASNNPASGSLKAEIPFTGASGEQFCFFGNFNNVGPWDNSVTLDGTKYSHVTFDIFVDPSSAMTPAGDFGSLAIGLATASWGQIWLNEWNLPVPLWPIPANATNEWVHCSIPIDPSVSGINNVAGVIFKMWSNGAHTNRLTFWLDNITLVARQEETPPPTMAIAKAQAGLQLFASQPGAQWQRQCIRTAGNGYAWLSYPYDPMTYSVTIKEFPPPAYAGFQVHIFLVPQATMPYGPDDGAIDWNAPNVIFVQITQNADGSGSARFMYKTNQPGGNSMLWNTDPAAGPVGTLAFLWSPTVRGTWSVTFNASEETIGMTAPDGSSTNWTMPPALAAPPGENLFEGPLYAYFGVQPNAMGNIGQSAVFSGVKIESGDPAFTPLEDDFSGQTLDTAKWAVVASDRAGVFVAPPESVYWVSWTLPDVGFGLQGSPSVGPPSWSDLTPAVLFRNNTRRMALITVPLLPAADAGYFRLAK